MPNLCAIYSTSLAAFLTGTEVLKNRLMEWHNNVRSLSIKANLFMDKRVQFDFEVLFTNGGSLTGQDVCVDIRGDDITDQELVRYIEQDMRLPGAGQARISKKRIFEEKHKRRSTDTHVLIDLSHTIENGL